MVKHYFELGKKDQIFGVELLRPFTYEDKSRHFDASTSVTYLLTTHFLSINLKVAL